jgi:hypothetical protein
VPRATKPNAQRDAAPAGWDIAQPLVLVGSIVPPLVEDPLAVPLEVPPVDVVPLVEVPLVEVPLVEVPLVEVPLVEVPLLVDASGGVVKVQ